jgi:hypothetical protein
MHRPARSFSAKADNLSVEHLVTEVLWTPPAGRWRRSPAAFARYGQKSANARIAVIE